MTSRQFVASDTRWKNALAEPVDQTLIAESEYDLTRPLYRCAVCRQEGELSLHKYVDECPFFEEAPQLHHPSSSPTGK